MFLNLILFSLVGFAGTSLENVRETCDTLTNDNVKEIQGYKIGKRKDHLLNHVRRRCEELEAAYDEGLWNSKVVELKIEELNLIQDSWIHKFKSDDGIGIMDLAFMGISHDLSPWLLRYDIPSSVGDFKSPEDSIFWTDVQNRRASYFAEQTLPLQMDPNIRFVVLKELEAKGSTPKAHVVDLQNGTRWLLKWGDEVHTDPVSSRIFAALGYYVDHSYYFDAGKLTLILGDLPNKKKRTVQHFVRFISNAYGINLSAFILKAGKINQDFLKQSPELASYKGQYFIQFKTAALEARPDLEHRLGGFMSNDPQNSKRRELRGALLAHLWIDNWDTKEDNTLLSILMDSKGRTSLRGSYSDLGVSLGVRISKFPRDLKAGLVNSFTWDLVRKEKGQIRFSAHLNHFSEAFKQATYEDLKWMAIQISQITEPILRSSLSASGWPIYLQELYFQKLAERRRQILAVFDVMDPNPISINKKYSFSEKDQWLVKDGELIVEPSLDLYPEGLMNPKGRIRGFGW